MAAALPFFFGSRGGGPSHSLSLPLFQTGLFTYTHTSHKKQAEGRGGAAPHYGNTRNRTSVGRSVDRMTRPNRRYGTEEPPRLGFLPCKKGGCGGDGRGGCSRGFFGGGGRRRLLVPKGGRMGEGGRRRLHYRLTNEQ